MHEDGYQPFKRLHEDGNLLTVFFIVMKVKADHFDDASLYLIYTDCNASQSKSS
jgi:hypothetical protein